MRQDSDLSKPITTLGQGFEPIMNGENTYDDLNEKGKPTKLEKANFYEINEFCKTSGKVKDFVVSKLYHLFKKVARDHVFLGKWIIDVKFSKKDTVCKIVDPDIVVGDDVTVENTFKVAKGLKIKIGWDVSGVESVSEFLKLLSSLSD